MAIVPSAKALGYFRASAPRTAFCCILTNIVRHEYSPSVEDAALLV